MKVGRDGILGQIGNTPLLKLGRIAAGGAQIFAKAEFLNPGGSVKDRIALAMIEDAERLGLVRAGVTIIEPTSGNTGIGLAMVCAVKGYKCVITMPQNMSLERIFALEAYGAEVVLTDSALGMTGAIDAANNLLKKYPDAFIPHQFTNAANVKVHRDTTAQEILRQAPGPIDAFVAGVGTGGTISGVARALKEKDSGTKVFAVEPQASAVLSGQKAGAHKIQGIGAGFVPDILRRDLIDEIITVSDMDAHRAAKRLAKEEGIFCGISSGAALFGALEVAKRLGAGKNIVTVFPDRGDRYFSCAQYFEF